MTTGTIPRRLWTFIQPGSGLVLLLSLLLVIGSGSPAPPAADAAPAAQHGPDGPITLHAAGRGNPWVNILDGQDLPVRYTGSATLTQALTDGQAHPLSLAAADFDEDGVPDLISGYAMDRNRVFDKNLVSNSGGMLTWHRGNVDSIYPNSPEARQRKAEGAFTDSPFLSPARVFEVPVAPDFLGAGDFDADGHQDVVAAARGGEALYLLSGDGQGGFGPARATRLPGKVTALVVGEIYRRDGLADVVAGVRDEKGSQVLVFKAPEGALRDEPQAFAVPAEVTALAVGQLDDHYAMDLAVAAGKALLIVHGGDGALLADAGRRAGGLPASVDKVRLPFAITALALGDFVPGESYPLEIALLSDDGAVHLLDQSDPGTWELTHRHPLLSPSSRRLLVRTNVSSLSTDDLVVLDPARRQVHIVVPVERGATQEEDGLWPLVGRPWSVALDVAGEPAAVLPMRLNVDALSDLVILKGGSGGLTVGQTAPMATYTVNTRYADLYDRWCPYPNAGEYPVQDCITGDMEPRDGICTTYRYNIIEENPLRYEWVPTGDDCTLGDAIQQANASPGLDEIRFNLGSGTPHAAYGRWPHDPYHEGLTDIRDSVTILGNTGGATRVSTGGLHFVDGHSTVRRMGVYRRIYLHDRANGTIIEGNFLGVDPTGTYARFVREGLQITTSNNTIGGTTPQARNVISRLEVGFGEGQGNVVQGNFIGTNANGTNALGNPDLDPPPDGPVGGKGIVIYLANNTIGGTEHDVGVCNRACNLISGNWTAIHLAVATGTLVQGNFIGTDLSGTAPLVDAFGYGNRGGVFIESASSNTIGGTAPGAGNIIAFNRGVGISIRGVDSVSNAILGNAIFSNSLGIGLGSRVSNDPGDGDTGPNNLQNYPVIASITSADGSTSLRRILNSTPNTTFRLEFFSNSRCDESGHGEGETFLSSTDVTTDGEGNATFQLPPGTNISVTATRKTAGGELTDTSEFSVCFDGRPLVVNSTGDAEDTVPGDGICYTGNLITRGATEERECTLRAAIQEIDALYDFFHFQDPVMIPFDIPGEGVPTIRPESPLPVVRHPVVIDGTTQPWVELDGGDAATYRHGLIIMGGNSTVQGLVINRFTGSGIVLTGNGGNVIQGNYIGTDIDGTAKRGNRIGITIEDSANNQIGGPAGEGNLISGNTEDGIRILGAGAIQNKVQGNYIGTNGAGTEALGNTLNGVVIIASENTIGGTEEGAGNVIAGNGAHGVLLTGRYFDIVGYDATQNKVQGNYIGTDWTGMVTDPDGQPNSGDELGNHQSGVAIDNASENTIGGTEEGAGNVIAGNQGTGVFILGAEATQNAILRNVIYSNEGLAIDLEADGVTPNDAGDGDTGANNLQNFPVIAGVSPGIITGTLTSTPNTPFRLQFFSYEICGEKADSSRPFLRGFGEGKQFLFSEDVAIDDTGTVTFTLTASSLGPGHAFAATATRLDSSSQPIETSEFSNTPFRLRASTPSFMPQNVFAPVHTVLLYTVLDEVQAQYLKDCIGEVDLYVVVDGDKSKAKKMENQGPANLGDADFHADDVHHSLWFKPIEDKTYTLDLYVAPAGEGFDQALFTDRLELSPTTAPELAVLTDFRALFDEFDEIAQVMRQPRNPAIEDNGPGRRGNGTLDYYDAVERIQQYAEDHNGIVIDVRRSTYGEVGYDYYSSDFQTRYMYAESIDSMVAVLPDPIKNLAIIGNDAVVPYRRVPVKSGIGAYDETRFANVEADPRDVITVQDIGTTTTESSKGHWMTDIPYGTRADTLPDEIRLDMGVGRVFREQPLDLVELIEEMEKPIVLDNNSSNTWVLTSPPDDNVDFTAETEWRLIPPVKRFHRKPCLGPPEYCPTPWVDYFIRVLGQPQHREVAYPDGWAYWVKGDVQLRDPRNPGDMRRRRRWNEFDVRRIIHEGDVLIFNTHGGDIGFLSPGIVGYDSLRDGTYRLVFGNACHVGLLPSFRHHTRIQGRTYWAARGVLESNAAMFSSTAYFTTAPFTFMDRYLAQMAGRVLRSLFSGRHATLGDLLKAVNTGYRCGLWCDVLDDQALYTYQLIGLPTQEIEIIRETAPARAAAATKGAFGTALISQETAAQQAAQTIDRSVVIPHFEETRDEENRVLFTIPHNGTINGQAFGPALPVVQHSYLLPPDAMDITVTTTFTQSRQYGEAVEMVPVTPVTLSGGPLTGAITLTNPYPETILGHRVYTDADGLRLDVELIPLQYNPDTGQVTLYDRIDYQITYNAPTTYTVQSIVVNNGAPVNVDQVALPITVALNASRPITGTLFWEIQDMGLRILGSGSGAVSLDPGTSQVDLNTDIVDWEPGPKQVIVSLSTVQSLDEARAVVASGQEMFTVQGRRLGVQADQSIYGAEDAAATFTALVLDESGAPISGLAGDLTQQLDGSDLALTWSEGGTYTTTLALTGVITGQHTLSVALSSGQVAETRFLVDRDPPASTLHSPVIADTVAFTVTIAGLDDLSGVDTYQVQYKVGETGAWTDWLTRTTGFDYTHTGLDDLEPIFGPTQPVTVTVGITYYFRVRAVDQAGNWEAEHSQPDTATTYYGTCDLTDDVSVAFVTAEPANLSAGAGVLSGAKAREPGSTGDFTPSLPLPRSLSAHPLVLTARVTNVGDVQVPDSLPVAFYLSDPGAGEALIGTAATTRALGAGESEDVSVTWEGDTSGDHTLTIVAGDEDPGRFTPCGEPPIAQQTISVLDVPLVESWNLVSSYVTPFNPDIRVVQRPIEGQYTVIHGIDGAYYPDLPAEVNTLKTVDAEHGYWIKAVGGGQLAVGSEQLADAEEEAVATLRVVGAALVEDWPIELDAGWNLVSYLPRQPLEVSEALLNIEGGYTAVLGFDQGALSYYPDLAPEVNTLRVLEPGHGYWIRMAQAGTLRYLAAATAAAGRPAAGPSAEELSALERRIAMIRAAERSASVRPTRTWTNFYGPAHRSDGTPLPVGATVLALDPDGVVCGAAVVTAEGGYGLLACYGDDLATPEDEGARPGDTIRLMVDGQVLGAGAWTAHGGRQWAPLGSVEMWEMRLPLVGVGD